MLKIGLPAGAEFALMGIYMAVIYAITKPFGSAAQGGFTIALRIVRVVRRSTVFPFRPHGIRYRLPLGILRAVLLQELLLHRLRTVGVVGRFREHELVHCEIVKPSLVRVLILRRRIDHVIVDADRTDEIIGVRRGDIGLRLFARESRGATDRLCPPIDAGIVQKIHHQPVLLQGLLGRPEERKGLVVQKLTRSPALAEAARRRGWRFVKWAPLRAFATAPEAGLDDLEPVLGLEPAAERSAHQLMFKW